MNIHVDFKGIRLEGSDEADAEQFKIELERSLREVLCTPTDEALVVDEDLLEELITLLADDKPFHADPDEGAIKNRANEVNRLSYRVAKIYAAVVGSPSKQRKVGIIGRKLIQISAISPESLIGLADDGSLWMAQLTGSLPRIPSWIEIESVPLF